MNTAAQIPLMILLEDLGIKVLQNYSFAVSIVKANCERSISDGHLCEINSNSTVVVTK